MKQPIINTSNSVISREMIDHETSTTVQTNINRDATFNDEKYSSYDTKSIMNISSDKADSVFRTKELSLFCSEKIRLYDVWNGKIIAVNDDTVDIVLHLEKCSAIKRVLRVNKTKLVGNTAALNIGRKIRYTYLEFYPYSSDSQQHIVKKSEFQVCYDAKFSKESVQASIERKVKRYSYLFETKPE